MATLAILGDALGSRSLAIAKTSCKPLGTPSANARSEAASMSRDCSPLHPLCVFLSPQRQLSDPMAVVAAADRAWDSLVDVLGIPPPDPGDDGIWHIILADSVEGGGEAQFEGLDPLARYARAISSARIDRSATGCRLDLSVARAIAQGSLLRASPSELDGLGIAEAEHLALLVTPCAMGDGDSLTFQSAPERSLADVQSKAFARGAAAFFDWLDVAYARSPGQIVPAIWAVSPSRSDAQGLCYRSDSSAIDVLGATLGSSSSIGSNLDDIFVEFAIARADMWPPPKAQWRVPWPVHPRRLISPIPVSPTGASYVSVDVAGAPRGAGLRLEMQWEDYARMKWVALKLDASGKTRAQIRATSPERATSAVLTIDVLEDVDRVVVVGVNVGSTEHRFSPDQAEWEPHGWMLTVEGVAP
jgi:hypothetical protein